MDKAKILYNHIYFSDLPENFIEEIYFNNRYIDIINHRNFNPRLIEFITDSVKLEYLLEQESYWDYIQKSLNNPKDVWRGTIDNQISTLDKHVVIAITLNNNSMSENEVCSLLINLKKLRIDNTSDYTNVNSIMRRLVGSMLNRHVSTDKQVTYSLFNPSIADFIISEYLSRTDYIAKIIICSRLPKTLLNINKIYLSKLTSIEYSKILENLVDAEKENQNTFDLYTLYLIDIAYSNSLDIYPLIERFSNLNQKENFKNFGSISLKAFKIAIDWDLINLNKFSLFINEILEDVDMDDFKYLSELISAIPNNHSTIIRFRKHLTSSFEKSITDFAVEDGKFDNIFDEEVTFHCDSYEYVYEILEEFDCISHITQEDINMIAKSIDFKHIIDHNDKKDYYSEMYVEECKEYKLCQNSEILTETSNPIEDLFQRN